MYSVVKVDGATAKRWLSKGLFHPSKSLAASLLRETKNTTIDLFERTDSRSCNISINSTASCNMNWLMFHVGPI